MVQGEIDGDTQAPSLTQMRNCISEELIDGKLQPLSDVLHDLKEQLMPRMQIGRGWVGTPSELAAFRKDVTDKVTLVDGIKLNMEQSVDRLVAEINRQRIELASASLVQPFHLLDRGPTARG